MRSLLKNFLSQDGVDPSALDWQALMPQSDLYLPSGDVVAQVNAAAHAQVTPASTQSLPFHSISYSNPTTGYIASGYEWGGVSFGTGGSYYYPPDNGMAANAASLGSETVVSAENGAIQLNVFTSGAISSTLDVSWTKLFGTPPSGYSYTDPRVLFNDNHFIVTVDEYNTTTASSNLVYAVSNSANPTDLTAGGSWQVHSVSTSNNSTWSDQPLVTENGNYLYITTNQFTSSGQYSSDYMTIVDTSTNTVTHQALNSWSYQPVQISDGSSNDQYFVSHSGSSLYVIDANGSSVTSLASIGGMPNNGSFSASQLGTNYKLDASDGRVNGAAYDATHNELYAVFEAQTSKSAPTVELVQFQPGSSTAQSVYALNNILAQLHTLTGLNTTGAATFNASVAVDGQGDLLVNFNVSGPNMLPADVFAVWKAANTGNLAAGPDLLADYQNSVAAYIDPGRDSVGRWGDYSTAVADASAKNAFFVSNEYDNGTIKLLGHTYSSWGTAIAEVTVA